MTRLIDRVDWAYRNLAPVEPRFVVVWEDPEDLDAPCLITTPAPNWLAAALHGGILPPVEVYHQLETDEDGRITNGHLLHETPPAGPMTEEEALEYLVQKDLPVGVWGDSQSNRPRFAIVPRDSIPTDRTHRNSWRLADFMGQEAA